ncbi:hypothetical protein DL93DRAFT_1333271 [Clavulina sp. PMI_390]|nr:hypothetical protein DL93DRAFT_1333271 [Clavulina sp. PMI_390]
MLELLSDHRAASVISGNSRCLNNTFAFTVIGFSGDSRHIPPGGHVSISGCSYHCMLHMDEGLHSLYWFLFNEAEREQHATEQHVDSAWLKQTRLALEEHNPYLQYLRSFTSEENVNYGAVELQAPMHRAISLLLPTSQIPLLSALKASQYGVNPKKPPNSLTRYLPTSNHSNIRFCSRMERLDGV